MRVGIKGVAPPPACLFPSPAAAPGRWWALPLPRAWPSCPMPVFVPWPQVALTAPLVLGCFPALPPPSLWVLIASSPVVVSAA